MTGSTELQELSIVQTIEAKPAAVYAAFTTEAGWLAWCCEEAEVDARPGGTLHILTEGYNAYGAFKALDPDHLVSFTWDGDGEPPTFIRVQLKAVENGTRVSFRGKRGMGSPSSWRASGGAHWTT